MDIDIQLLANAEEINDIIALQTKCLLEINSRDYTPQQIKSLIKSQQTMRYNLKEITFLAKLNKQLIGFACISAYEPVIGGIYVHPQYNGLGIGKKLLKNIENIAREKKYNILYVTSSLTAIKFYQSQGYQQSQAYPKIKKSGFLSDSRIWIPTVKLHKQFKPLTFRDKVFHSFYIYENLSIMMLSSLIVIIIIINK